MDKPEELNYIRQQILDLQARKDLPAKAQKQLQILMDRERQLIAEIEKEQL